jgi:hypothetical protein
MTATFIRKRQLFPVGHQTGIAPRKHGGGRCIMASSYTYFRALRWLVFESRGFGEAL